MENKLMTSLAVSAALLSGCVHEANKETPEEQKAVSVADSIEKKFNPDAMGYVVGRRYVFDKKADEVQMYFFISTRADDRRPEYIGGYGEQTLTFLEASSEVYPDAPVWRMPLGKWAEALQDFRSVETLTPAEKTILKPQRRQILVPDEEREY